MEYKFVKLVKLKDDKKKYKAVFKNLKTGKVKNVKFGASGYSHYTEGHLDEKRRLSYELRHKKSNCLFSNLQALSSRIRYREIGQVQIPGGPGPGHHPYNKNQS